MPYYIAKVYVDIAMSLPIRFEAYDWPEQPEGAPQLIEEYTYLDLKLTDRLTDEDFDPDNPDYSFSRRSSNPRLAAVVE